MQAKTRESNDFSEYSSELTAFNSEDKQENTKDAKAELSEDSHLINMASGNAPRGKMQLATCFALLFFTLLFRDEEYCVKVACAGCIISTFFTIYYKLHLQASSTYVLCALSVIMNSIAFGYLLPPMT